MISSFMIIIIVITIILGNFVVAKLSLVLCMLVCSVNKLKVLPYYTFLFVHIRSQ